MLFLVPTVALWDMGISKPALKYIVSSAATMKVVEDLQNIFNSFEDDIYQLDKDIATKLKVIFTYFMP